MTDGDLQAAAARLQQRIKRYLDTAPGLSPKASMLDESADLLAQLVSALGEAQPIIAKLKAVDDPYEDFEGNAKACRFCFARHFRPHAVDCIWATLQGSAPPSEERT